jgi:uncharacterized protein YuzE
MASVTFDREAKALYVKVSKGKPVKTIPMGEGAFMDISKDGKAIGLEIVFPESTPQEALDAIIGMSKSTQLVRAKGMRLLPV